MRPIVQALVQTISNRMIKLSSPLPAELFEFDYYEDGFPKLPVQQLCR
jgi:hypothetical protein